MPRSMPVAERNRLIKKTLETAFGRGKVRVWGDRGTAYGWVNVRIDWTPLDVDAAREMKILVWKLLDKAKLSNEIGTYGYDDPGSDYGYGSKLSLNFNTCRYFRTMKHSDGTMSVMRDSFGGWESAPVECAA